LRSIWRSAAGLTLLPFLAAPLLPALPVRAAAPLPDVPALEPFFVKPGDALAAAPATALSLPDLASLLAGILVLGWAVRFGLWLISQVRLQSLKSRAIAARRPVGHWADVLELRQTPDIRVIPAGAPFLAGIVRPAIFVPAALIETFAARDILVHEMVHLKQGDLISRPLERLVADIFWFSPFAWGIRSALDYWREAEVDEKAVALTGDPIAYARALTRAARLARPVMSLPVAAFTLKREGTLKMRLNLLLTEKPRSRRLGVAAAVLLACAAPLAIAQGLLIKGAAPTLSASLDYSHPVLDKAKLTSSFGERKHPVTGELKLHRGVDLAEEEGKPIYAPVAASVTRAEFSEGYGNVVELAAPAGTTLRFAQMKNLHVAPGDIVAPGTVIGTIGQTGQATGPHLHLEVWRAGAPLDPESEKGLVLAETLRVMNGARPLAPIPASAPAAPEPAVPAAPPTACDELSLQLLSTALPAGWKERLAEAAAANRAAGIGPEINPETVSYPTPGYPPLAAEKLVSGACDILFDLGTDGKPKNATARCTDPLFVAEAEALRGATFVPPRNASGKPVEAKGIVYPMQFCVE
jgi:murein DD-endopeptidase MepM/ murein hydrolase activator NlpD